MINDLPWRKFPRDAIRNEELDYISFTLGDELATAPYMFFMTMYCRADDDGVFDIGDGCVFSRLMRCGNPQDVFQIAQLFVDRGLISPVDDSVYIINDWEVPNRPNVTRAKTAEERRAAVARKIAESKKARKDVETVKELYVKFPNTDDFFCPYDDKKADFVAKTEREERQRIDNDRDQITTDKQTSEIRQNFLKREIENRHTQEKDNFRGFGKEPLQLSTENLESQRQKEEAKTEAELLAEQALSFSEVDFSNSNTTENKGRECGDKMQVGVILEAVKQFFAKNCYGINFDASEIKAMQEISRRCIGLGDSKNTPDIIATVYLAQFKQFSEQGYYKNMPMLPSFFLKKDIYLRVANACSKILFSGQKRDVVAEYEEFKQEADRDYAAVGNKIEAECLKYGVDPKASDRMALLLQAKETAIK